ncbi:hypothetical protein E2C01_016651 [Portunus trituberculatus]|uniref:Uncharacterized protein n=1 Tax=Portunus trituberculatus TaxID=210409 RepID=A0A5B7DRC1_PORTR|nr:hypothetical protein [Portunus trituberculatus]
MKNKTQHEKTEETKDGGKRERVREEGREVGRKDAESYPPAPYSLQNITICLYSDSCALLPFSGGFLLPAARRDLPSPLFSELNEDELFSSKLCQSRLGGEPQAVALISSHPALTLARAYQRRTDHSLRPLALQAPLLTHAFLAR